MNKRQAEQIARSGHITWGELQEALRRAYENGAADERQSIVNKGFTKATAYNVMCGYAQDYHPDRIVDAGQYGEWVGARHILREFGKFWQGWTPELPTPKETPPLQHQEPMLPPF